MLTVSEKFLMSEIHIIINTFLGQKPNN